MNAYSFAHLKWPYHRKAKPFKVRTVEPRKYGPSTHGEVFMAVMRDLIKPAEAPLDLFSNFGPQNPPDFDLVTFPEAFVAVDVLIQTMEIMSRLDPSGCFHVGIRPSDTSNHLFSKQEAKELADGLSALSNFAGSDLKVFRAWLDEVADCEMINLACLFLIDADRELRVCLHPKLVRSRFELAVFPEDHMAEATLLTLVTLKPTDKKLTEINLQPLICSDATNLLPDRSAGGPIAILNQHPDLFEGEVPDHIDVVSVVTCTPQQTDVTKDSMAYRQWHERFSVVFTGAQERVRHHFAAFVLANFLELEDGTAGGASGIYLPVSPPEEFESGLEVSCFGKPRSAPLKGNCWSQPDDVALTRWNNRGFTVGLAAWDDRGDAVRVFQGTIARLPRENPLWETRQSIADCKVRVGTRAANGQIMFEWLAESGRREPAQ